MLGKILIAGAGAIGSVVGGFLRKGGEQITLLGRQDHIRAVKENGLEIEGIWGSHQVKGLGLAVDFRELKEDYDLIFVTVKSYDTLAMAEEAASRLKPDGLMISLQNGLGNVEKIVQYTALVQNAFYICHRRRAFIIGGRW